MAPMARAEYGIKLIIQLLVVILVVQLVAGKTTRHYSFHVRSKNVTRLCHTKPLITVNGKSPGPKVVVREGDRVIIKVHNHVSNNVSIHWHGVRQLRSGWADGPSYITQCPIQTGQTYVYNFTVTGQRGTLWWHAHISWLRASVYGAFIIYPKRHVPYPFPKPYKEVPMILGEWWNADTENVVNQAMQTGGGPNVSDCYTINGHPGPLYNCSAINDFRRSRFLQTSEGAKLMPPIAKCKNANASCSKMKKGKGKTGMPTAI